MHWNNILLVLIYEMHFLVSLITNPWILLRSYYYKVRCWTRLAYQTKNKNHFPPINQPLNWRLTFGMSSVENCQFYSIWVLCTIHRLSISEVFYKFYFAKHISAVRGDSMAELFNALLACPKVSLLKSRGDETYFLNIFQITI